MTEIGSIQVRVLFFGATADAAGTRSIDLAVPAGSTADDAFRDLLSANSQLGAHKLLYSVNQTYARGDEILQDGDELAVFTAVSGG